MSVTRTVVLVIALVVGILAALGVSAMGQEKQELPRIEAIQGGELFIVSYKPGAVWSCTVYRMTVATEDPNGAFPDGHYAPRHCWALDEKSSAYTDDWEWIRKYDVEWEVWAEVGYPVGNTPEVTYTKTNVIKVTR